MSRTRKLSAGAAVAFAVAVGMGSTASAASPKASCIGQFFSEHAGLVPATGGEESVGGFISETARTSGRDFGAEISGARSRPRDACGL